MTVTQLAADPAPDMLAALQAEDWDGARQGAEGILEEHPDDLQALFVLGLAAFHQGDLALAASVTHRAMETNGNVQELARVLSVYFALAGEVNSSLYYGKLSMALPAQPAISALIPESFPRFESVFRHISESPLLARAEAAAARLTWTDAEEWYRQHLTFRPDDRSALIGLAECLVAQGNLKSAVESLRSACHARPDDVAVAGMLAEVLAKLGSFSESRACHRWVQELAPDDAAVHAAAVMDALRDPEFPAEQAIAWTAAWGRRFGVHEAAAAPIAKAMPKDRLTIGYVVGELGGTTLADGLSAILAKHDPTQFQTVGFGFGALSDNVNLPFQKCMDRWHDVAAIDPLTLKAMIGAEEVDILVDASGFATPELLIAFGNRMAPCQVSWMGAPAGTGLAAMDAVLTDAVLDPDAGSGLSEKLARLTLGAVVVSPQTYRGDELAPRAADNVIFAADALDAEINPATVALWSRILHRVPQSTLILRDHGYRSGSGLDRLVGLFGNFGVAHRVDVVTEPLAARFFAAADVALMPLPMPRPQSAVEALWGGCPVICLSGPARHTRPAASLLHHAGLGAKERETMIAGGEQAYIEHAVQWAGDDTGRAAFRATVRERLVKGDALNPEKRVRDLEAVLTDLWRQACERS